MLFLILINDFVLSSGRTLLEFDFTLNANGHLLDRLLSFSLYYSIEIVRLYYLYIFLYSAILYFLTSFLLLIASFISSGDRTLS